MSDDSISYRQKLKTMRKKKSSDSEGSKSKGTSTIRTSKVSGWELVLRFVTSRKVHFFFYTVIVALIIYAVWIYVHWGVILGFAMIFPISLLIDYHLRRGDHVVIFELDRETWTPALYWCRRNYYSKMEKEDGPCIMESKNGNKIVICQDFDPENKKIEFGWMQDHSPQEFMVDRSKFTSQSDFIDRLVNMIVEGKADGERIAMEMSNEFLENIAEHPMGQLPVQNEEDLPSTRLKGD